MPKVQLMNLTCSKTEDLLGPDEPYLRINGLVIWGPVSLNTGQTHSLAAVPAIPFFGLASIELFDQDVGGIFDPDDFLGAVAVTAGMTGTGPQVGSFTGDGASYLLIYQVIA